MEQRPQHGHQHQVPFGTSHQPAPWPQPQAGTAMPAPSLQHAPSGFVLPGASAGQAPPMSSHGGMIGVPQQASPAAHEPAFVQDRYAYATPGAHHAAYGAPAPDPMQHPNTMTTALAAQQPQAWAYPTTNGLQLVQPGGAAPHPGQHAPAIAIARAGRPRTRSRIRWETIVPAAAVACLVAAIGVFFHDFDRITGRDQVAAAAPAAATSTKDTATAAAGDDAATIKQARTLMQRGRFGDASNMLAPLVDRPKPSAAAARLKRQVDQRASRNTALLRRLGKERSAKQWSKVIVTVGQLEKLRPLSVDLKRARTSARTNLKQERAAAAAKRRTAALASARPSTGGGGAPAAGGIPRATTAPASRPPAAVPSGSIPTRPDVPNSTGGSGNVAGGGPQASSGGGTANAGCTWMVMDGVSMCM